MKSKSTEKLPLKIMIVDDNEQARKMIRHYLQEIAADVVECDDGENALACYDDFQPDWVLMDWEMKTDGLTATKRIIEAHPEARILMVTQHNDAELREAAKQAGAHGFILKDNLFSLNSFLLES